MVSDSSPPPPNPGDSSDNRSRRPNEVSRILPVIGHITTFTYGAEPPSPAFQFNHDKAKRLLVLTWPDGKTEQLRDNPIRQARGRARSRDRRVAASGDQERAAGWFCLSVPRGTRDRELESEGAAAGKEIEQKATKVTKVRRGLSTEGTEGHGKGLPS